MKFVSHAKCILSGEHTVLRGGYAIALPIEQSYLKMEWHDNETFLAEFTGPRGDEVKIPFSMAIDKALELVGKSRGDLKGKLNIYNNIAVGSGLGASAAVCVAITKLFIHYSWVEEVKAFDFAKSLEDVFHGESSGLDVAVSLYNKSVLFHREEGIQDLELIWKPNLYLSSCGSRGLTADCIAKVKKVIESNPLLAEKIDEKMKKSVEIVLAGLKVENDNQKIVEGLNLGLSCFEDWNLVNANLREHMQNLKDQGAIAMKPTGSGDGGYVLSLWPEGVKLDKERFTSLF